MCGRKKVARRRELGEHGRTCGERRMESDDAKTMKPAAAQSTSHAKSPHPGTKRIQRCAEKESGEEERGLGEASRPVTVLVVDQQQSPANGGSKGNEVSPSH